MILAIILFTITLFSSSICCGLFFKYEIERKTGKLQLSIMGWILSLLLCATAFAKIGMDAYTQGAIDYYHNKIKITEQIIRTQSGYKLERIK